jgi:GMP synthase (glutamine-hydrolysing)
MGHQDIVERLPADAVLLASTDRVENQAFRFAGKPIYCTQFHPELRAADLALRLKTYPHYVERLAGMPADEFFAALHEAPGAQDVLTRFAEQCV